MIKRIGEPVRAGVKYTLRPGAYAILWNGQGLLVTLQSSATTEIQLPGGGIDPGETPIQSLHREVREETGWVISTPRRLGAFRRFVYMPEYDLWAEKMCSIYLARPVLKRGAPSEPDHLALWMHPEKAFELLSNDGDREFVYRWWSAR